MAISHEDIGWMILPLFPLSLFVVITYFLYKACKRHRVAVSEMEGLRSAQQQEPAINMYCVRVIPVQTKIATAPSRESEDAESQED